MVFWQFSRNNTYVSIPGKLSEVYLHAWLFSNPCEKVLIIVGILWSPDLRVQHMSNLLDTMLAYDSSCIEHWTSCNDIIHMLGWFFVLKMFLILKHTFSRCRNITLSTLNYFKCIDASFWCDSIECVTDEWWTNTCRVTFGQERHLYWIGVIA